MTIIKKIPDWNGWHDIEEQSHRKNCWIDGYIAVPASLEKLAWDSGGWCDLEIQDGVLVGITPTEKPIPSDPEEPGDDRQAVEQEITDLMLADMEQGQFATALQLQLMEVMGQHV